MFGAADCLDSFEVGIVVKDIEPGRKAAGLGLGR